ncbi:hypothetical protein HCH54_006739 [Aspergillus fumigatus]
MASSRHQSLETLRSTDHARLNFLWECSDSPDTLEDIIEKLFPTAGVHWSRNELYFTSRSRHSTIAAQFYKRRTGHQSDLEQDHISDYLAHEAYGVLPSAPLQQVVPRVNPSDSNLGFRKVNMNQHR